ncbi:MAG: hypothetical protein AB1486_10780 [Planctomycetota bacterium]
MDADHEIFQSPLAVNPTFIEIDTPQNYRSYPDGEALPKKLKGWKVQEPTYPAVDPGVISNPYGFEDTPDAEVISSGVNSKGPNSAALARHANFFLWGFSAPPSQMTEEGRRCFVNAVCYISKFGGKSPLTQAIAHARDYALIYANYVGQVNDENFLKRLFPPELRDKFGKDAQQYKAYYQENFEYLRPRSEGGYEVDEDAKALGASNRSVGLLEACIAKLESGADTERAVRLLERYTAEQHGKDAKAWRSWLDKNRNALYFSDSAGFKFLVDAAKLGARTAASH